MRHEGIWGEAEVQLHKFLTSVLDGGECRLHASAALIPRTAPIIHWMGASVGPKPGLDSWQRITNLLSLPYSTEYFHFHNNCLNKVNIITCAHLNVFIGWDDATPHIHDSQVILRHMGLYERIPQNRYVGIRNNTTRKKRQARCVWDISPKWTVVGSGL
jgi:hypothetical protein